MRLFVDELEAAEVGYAELIRIGKEKNADHYTPFEFEGANGGAAVLWKDGLIIAYFLILRNENNYSILIQNEIEGGYDDKEND